MAVKHNFHKVQQEYAKLKRNLPKLIGAEAVSFAKDNFRKQGFHDVTLKRWKPRKRGAPRNKGRALLVDTGRLKRSVRVTRITPKKVHIGSNVAYAKIHNEGGTVQTTQKVRAHNRRTQRGLSRVRAHTRKVNIRIPRRKFIGPSVELDRRIGRMVSLKLLKVFKA